MPDYRANNNFGALSEINVEALGIPGARTFRLLIQAGVASACLWLEKEQLQQMAIYIEEIITNTRFTSAGEGSDISDISETTWSAEYVSLEFTVESLSLGYDPASNGFLFLAYDRQGYDDSAADLSFWITLEMAQVLSKEALEICTAGRPRCFLCGKAIDTEGHACVRSNGHQSLEH